MIHESDAEDAIRNLADRLPEESDQMIATMVDAAAAAPDASIVKHQEWRETGGIPHFRAIIHYHNKRGNMLIGGDYINVEVTGTFNETRKGLTIKDYTVKECRVVDPREKYVKPF